MGTSAPTLQVLDFGTKTITDFNPAEDKIQIDVKAYYDHYKSVDFKSSHNASDDIFTIKLAGHNVATLNGIRSSQPAFLTNSAITKHRSLVGE
ncbi:MAG: hypothetical protein AAGJ08_12475 [Cyanobacteria bacterium P01_H01_bin.35]